MIIDYSVQKTFEQSLIIDDIGHFYIRCYGSSIIDGAPCECEYYMAANTVMGKVSILKYGPIIPDLGIMLNGFNVSYKELKFNEKKIEKEVSLFLNDNPKGIYNVEEISEDEFLEQIPAIVMPS